MTHPRQFHSYLLRQFEGEYDRVLAKIANRNTMPLLSRSLSESFYKIANFMTGGLLPESVSNFRLVSRKSFEAIRTLRESYRFLRGLGSWEGFKTTNIENESPPSYTGEF